MRSSFEPENPLGMKNFYRLFVKIPANCPYLNASFGKLLLARHGNQSNFGLVDPVPHGQGGRRIPVGLQHGERAHIPSQVFPNTNGI